MHDQAWGPPALTLAPVLLTWRSEVEKEEVMFAESQDGNGRSLVGTGVSDPSLRSFLCTLQCQTLQLRVLKSLSRTTNSTAQNWACAA